MRHMQGMERMVQIGSQEHFAGWRVRLSRVHIARDYRSLESVRLKIVMYLVMQDKEDFLYNKKLYFAP